MPTDTIDTSNPRPITALLDEFLAQVPAGATAQLAQGMRDIGMDAEALVELLASALRHGGDAPHGLTALRRRERSAVPDPVGFLGGGCWTHTAEQRRFTRTYSADVLVRIEPVSAISTGWLVFIGDNLLRRADGSVAVFDTSEAAMRSAEWVMAEMKTTVAIPAAL